MRPIMAAKKLQEELGGPKGSIAVWTWLEDDGESRLIVNIRPDFYFDRGKVPEIYQGYRVRIQDKETLVPASVRPLAQAF